MAGDRAEGAFPAFAAGDALGNVTLRLDRRSAAILTGDARYRWTHEIPKRKNEPGRVARGRRLSLTFRKVLAPASRREERRHA